MLHPRVVEKFNVHPKRRSVGSDRFMSILSILALGFSGPELQHQSRQNCVTVTTLWPEPFAMPQYAVAVTLA